MSEPSLGSVFFSYAREDAAYVEAMIVRLRAAGVDVWYDRDIVPGESYPDALTRALKRSHSLIVALTAWSVTSEFVQKEVLFAQTHKNVVIPVLVEDVELPLNLIDQQYVEGRDGRDPLPELLARLHAPVPPPGPPAPPVPAGSEIDDGRRRGRRVLALAILAWIGYCTWSDLGPVRPVDRTALTRLLSGHSWVGYDPGPISRWEARGAFVVRIVWDLRRIRNAGFTGVVTYGGHGSLTQIPRLAREEGLAVIMGIWNAADSHEVDRAVFVRRFVDGYCVGHNGLGARYSIDALERAVSRIRHRTGLPVTTTEEARFYTDGAVLHERLCTVGDWLFPDVHFSLRESATGRPDLSRDVASYLTRGRDMARIAKKLDLPLMFKIVTYPHGGFPGTSEENQCKFYAALIKDLRDPDGGMPVRATLTAHSAFDDAWKSGTPFFLWDPYTGLIRPNGTARPAVMEILRYVE